MNVEGGIAPPSTIASLHHHRRTNSAPTTPVPSERKTTTSDRVDEGGDRAFFNSPQQKQQQKRLLLLRSRSSSVVSKQRIIVESPRLHESDALLFPASKHGPLRNTNYLQSYEARFQYIQQQQQGSTATRNNNNNNNMTVLCIDYRLIHVRQIAPQTLQYGILPQCAVLIQTLYIPLLTRSSNNNNHNNNINNSSSKTSTTTTASHQQQQQLRKMLKSIVAWMDVLSRHFPNLKHIYIQPTPLSSSQVFGRDRGDDDDTNTVELPPTTTTTATASVVTPEELHIWRTYVVHRLPTLESIDGVTITTHERNESKSLFARDHHPGTTTSQQQPQRSTQSSPDMRRHSDGDHGISCYTHQARAKLLASHPFMGTTTRKQMSLPPKTKKTIPKKSRRNVNDGLEPLKYCLLDNLVDDDDDDDDNHVEPNDNDDGHVNENDKPIGTTGHNKVTSRNRRIILALDDFAVEVKQHESPEKVRKSRTAAMHRTSDLVPPTAWSRQNRPSVGRHHSTTTTTTVDSLPYNPSLSFEQDHHHHQDWEYVSASGESSVHALNACAAWTTACGTLTSSLYNFRSLSGSSSSNIQNSNHKTTNRSRPISSQEKPNADLGHGGGVLNDLRMKTDHIKSKFHLLQQHRKMKKEFAHPTLLEPQDTAVVPSQMNGAQDLNRAPGQLMKPVDTLQVKTTYADTAKQSDSKSLMVTPQPPRGGATPTVDMTLRSANMFHIPYPLTQSRSSPTKLPSLSVASIHNHATRSGSVPPPPNLRLHDHPSSQNSELPPPGPRRPWPPNPM